MKYPQSFFKSLGKYGCYALCIVELAREITGIKFDDVPSIEAGIEARYIRFNKQNYEDENNFYVDFPDKFLSMLTKDTWQITKENADYKLKKGEYAVEWWSIDGKSGHFAIVKNGYNSLQYSNNVAKGKVYSYRVFRRG